MIEKEIQNAINNQITRELFASNYYLSIASYMDSQGLKVLAAFFFNQSDEERGHALRLLHYLLDVNGNVEIDAVPHPEGPPKSVEKAVQASLDHEIQVTKQINELMNLANKKKDYATASFLRWFVDEQVEEQSVMTDLLDLIRHAGKDHLLLVEDRLMKQGVTPKQPTTPQ